MANEIETQTLTIWSNRPHRHSSCFAAGALAEVKITTEPLHNTLTELETLDEQTVYKHKNGWPTQPC